ncbi:MAG: retroviral-like aspartic protease family protein [Planctomycetaceae bacterium]|jgi:hypothetical protein|nr:retroviral-like aspartic protease family protein [Planctomycetaceae bacterium]
MSSKVIQYSFQYRPIIYVLLENTHDSSVPPLRFAALIDTGATISTVPFSACKTLKHTFEQGTSPTSVFGVGGSRRIFVHATRLTVLEPVINGVMVPPSKPIFEAIDFQLTFVEQHLSFVLLGQKDFLQHFKYVQNAQAGWFSLERI